MARKAILIDRDGTLCEPPPGDGAALRLLPRAAAAVSRANAAGFQTVLITNQPAVTADRLADLHDHLRETLLESGARLDGIYHCPHAPADPCDCRKPAPGMLLRARDQMGIDLGRSYVVGDRLSDVAAGAAVGATALLVLTGEGQRERERASAVAPSPSFVAEDLFDAVEWILGHDSGGGA